MGACAIFLLAIYLLFSFFFHSPLIVFDENSITVKHIFKSSVYSWNQVSNVFLSTKEYYSVFIILGQTFESMKLVFSDGKSLIIWEDMYRNMDEMRELVTEKLNDTIHFMKKSSDRPVVNLFSEKKYSGNALTSFNTLLIIGMIIFFCVKLEIKEGREWFMLIPFFFILLLYIFSGMQMNFFEIKYDKFIVRNQYFPWKKREYNLNDIEEVSTESPYRRSTGLRIITYQFESKFYGAGSLRSHTWEELLKDMALMGIKTKND